MAKIDVTKITGFDEMTAEEKVAALTAFDVDDGAAEIERLKGSLSKANGEAADWKRKYNARLSEEERKAQESAQELEDLRNEVAAFKREKTEAIYTSKLIAQGYSEELALDTAKAMIDGDSTKVFANQQAFLVEYEKKVKADALKGTPRPPVGNDNDGAVIDYKAKAQEAQQSGDYQTAAYYTRLAAEEEAARK